MTAPRCCTWHTQSWPRRSRRRDVPGSVALVPITPAVRVRRVRRAPRSVIDSRVPLIGPLPNVADHVLCPPHAVAPRSSVGVTRCRAGGREIAPRLVIRRPVCGPQPFFPRRQPLPRCATQRARLEPCHVARGTHRRSYTQRERWRPRALSCRRGRGPHPVPRHHREERVAVAIDRRPRPLAVRPDRRPRPAHADRGSPPYRRAPSDHPSLAHTPRGGRCSPWPDRRTSRTAPGSPPPSATSTPSTSARR